MTSWKLKSISFVLFVAIIAPSLVWIFAPKTQVEAAIFNCAPSVAEQVTRTGAQTAENAAYSTLGVPVDIGPVYKTSLTQGAGAAVSDNRKTSCMDGIGWMLAKIAVAYITQSVVQWINSGFNGSPTFITDPKGFILKVADEQFANIMTTLFPSTSGLADLVCSPFSLDIKLKLALKFNFNYKRLNIPSGCSLTDISNNIGGAVGGAQQSITEQYNDFTSGNFSNGGWDRWYEITQNSDNNKYGAELNTDIAVTAAIEDAQGQEVDLLNSNNWFKSLTKGEGNITGAINSIITPGKQIQGMLSNSIQDPTDELKLADSIDEIVGALIQQLIGQAIGDGGIAGLSQTDTSEGQTSSYADQILEERNAMEEENTNDQNTIPQPPGLPTSTPPISGGGQPNTPTNVALNKRPQQSSNYAGSTGAIKAVDGMTQDVPVQDFYAITNSQVQAWWQVDLEQSEDIGSIEVWPRGDATDPLNNFYVLVSDQPISGSLDQIIADSSVRKFRISGGIANPPQVINVNGMGRYVRVQRADTTPKFLELLEVRVISRPTEN